MPRGFKRNHTATAIARLQGYITDHRSFVSQEKAIPGEWEGELHTHLVLYGRDKCRIREIIFERNREANRGYNRCWQCRELVRELEDDQPLSGVPVGEWHHIRNKPGERCDCAENGRVSCRNCHREQHPRPAFTPKNNLQN